MKIFLILLISTGFIMSCENNSVFNESTPKDSSESIRSFSKSDILVEYVGLPEPKKYDAKISWKESNYVLKFVKNNQYFFDSSKSADKSQYLFKNLSSGFEFNFDIEIYNELNNLLESVPVSLKIPEDVVFQREYTLSQDTQIKAHRVFLTENLVLSTLNHHLKIEANEIVSIGSSMLQNFNLTAKAPINEPGLDGGNIEITSQRVIGDLKIILNAQAGGDGLSGKHYERETICYNSTPPGEFVTQIEITPCQVQVTDGCIGSSGKNAGNTGSLRLFVNDDSKSKINYQFIETAGGNIGPHGNLRTPNYPIDRTNFGCRNTPSVGSSAKKGIICSVLSGSGINDCSN